MAFSATASVGAVFFPLPVYATPLSPGMQAFCWGMMNFLQFCKLLNKRSLVYSKLVFCRVVHIIVFPSSSRSISYTFFNTFNVVSLPFLSSPQDHNAIVSSPPSLPTIPISYLTFGLWGGKRCRVLWLGWELHMCWLEWLVCTCCVAWTLSQAVCLNNIFSLLFPQ